MGSIILSHVGRPEIVECAVLLAFLAFSWWWPSWGSSIFGRLESFGAHLAQRKRLTILLLASVTIALRLSLLWLLPVPVPHVHDEFSYLLAGDTFAHGRLTNPTHPMWIFFDTFHVNQHPTYMSKYPPAQGMVLAMGQLLGHPWIGVVLTTAVMCSAALWMLYGWLPPPWALLGGLLIFLRLAVFSYWMNSYWGGAIPAIGGALVLGATPRLMRSQRWRDAVLLGLGAALLANSRPMEGLIVCLAVALFLAVSLFAMRSTLTRDVWLRLILPFSAMIFLCGSFMAYYNRRVTGDLLLFPYVVNENTYVSTPTLFCEKPRPPLRYQNAQFEDYYNEWMRAQWLEGRVDSFAQAVRHIGLSGIKVTYFFLWPELCLPFLALPWILRDRRTLFLIAVLAVSFLGFLLVPWTQGHYAAPVTAALFAVVVQGIMHLREWKPAGRPVGIGFSRVIVLFALLLAPLHPHSQAMGNSGPAGIEYRAQFEKQLSKLPGKHLVIVRYSANHPVLQEWVYNSADIDGAKVVWTREIPGIALNPLLDYFHDRTFWLVEPDLPVPRLSPCSPAHLCGLK